MAVIYISSTFEDLKKEREAAARAIKSLGHTVIAMEEYVASNECPLEKCLEDVKKCHVYIGIFALRYGHIAHGYDKSITHLEYETARDAKIPCLIFLLDETANWPVRHVSTGEERLKIEKLRQELQEEHIVNFFIDDAQLHDHVKASVSKIAPEVKGIAMDLTKTGDKPRKKWVLAAASLIVLIAISLFFKGPIIKWLRQPGPNKEVTNVKQQQNDDAFASAKKKDTIKANDEKIEEFNEMPVDVRALILKAQKVYKNKKDFWEADYGDGIKMVYIPKGEFTMGANVYRNEKPLHKVYLDGYWMGKTEVTMKQYKAFINEKRYRSLPDYAQKYSPGNEHPVVGVSWEDAVAYCKWLSKKTGLNFKLPSEAQWEKAAQGIERLKYPWGNHGPFYNGKWYANYAAHDSWDKKGADGFEYTAPVGSYPIGASPYGLMDMAGNVWEWCNDWHAFYSSKPQVNPTGPRGGTGRVMRGGGWFIFAKLLRCANRNSERPSYHSGFVGFRLCQNN
ncbi:MAG: SUMF1/EgtB/PvdO family nonheme iron enzyme [Candidatus Aminicenantes bacterium]|jgi:formylglycine-generating enzyme required for sulfatase activity